MTDSVPQRRGLRPRFDRLRTRLLLSFAAASGALMLAASLAVGWSIESDFFESLARADRARLDAFATRLASEYRDERGWDALAADRERWQRLSREALGFTRGLRDPALGEIPLTIDPRLMLFDAERRLLIGSDERAAEAERVPISVDDATVGYLGYVPRRRLAESIDALFAQRQRDKLLAIGAAMFVASLLVAAGLAQWLSRRILRIAAATDALIAGDYDVRLDPAGHDEIAQLSRNFNRLAETLAAARQSRRQWIADIAHELRTPLAVLRGEIEAMQDGVRRLDDGSLASLAQEVGRLGRLIEDLRLLSSADLGALTYRMESFDLADVIAEAIGAHRRSLDEQQLDCRLQLAEGCIVRADRERIVQVFGNLIQNTLRYTDAPGRVAVALTCSDGDAVVCWDDSSPGVPADRLPWLTERLYRVDESRSRAHGGSGLGLAIVRAIVDAHGGALVAGPSPLGGLRIELRIPLDRGESR